MSAPSPFRLVSIKDGRTVSIDSRFITSIPSQDNFTQFSSQFLYEATLELVNTALDKYMVSTEQQPLISHQITSAYCDHLKGDEIAPDPIIDKEGFGLWLKAVAWYQKDLIHGWRTDLPPADNTLTINLVTGDYY